VRDILVRHTSAIIGNIRYALKTVSNGMDLEKGIRSFDIAIFRRQLTTSYSNIKPSFLPPSPDALGVVFFDPWVSNLASAPISIKRSRVLTMGRDRQGTTRCGVLDIRRSAIERKSITANRSRWLAHVDTSRLVHRSRAPWRPMTGYQLITSRRSTSGRKTWSYIIWRFVCEFSSGVSCIQTNQLRMLLLH